MREPLITRMPAITIAGWYRESNTDNFGPDLVELWGEALEDNFPASLPGSSDPDTAHVITRDWFTDSAPLSLLLGAEVPSDYAENETIRCVTFPETTCAVFMAPCPTLSKTGTVSGAGLSRVRKTGHASTASGDTTTGHCWVTSASRL